MPELPEVETTRRSLVPHLIGARITDVTVRDHRLRQPLAADFAVRLRTRAIDAIDRRGKYLLFDLDDGAALLVHLGMSGSLELAEATLPFAAHDHVAIALDRGMRLVFNDPRRFGLLQVGHRSTLAEWCGVGRDALADPPGLEDWRALTRGRRLPIKNLLMDQRVLGGIGNIYANEMLFQAGIRPRRRAASLSRNQLVRLGEAMQAVLARALALGGSSISDYRDANGRRGNFQIHHAVYDRAGQPCVACGAPIKCIVLSGRSTFYCPRCQS
ncbi:MAG: bifunctional DNA-formamidopyrimidine glycosylase/DNA-(apurinic or apyrimidinic site) lyase [Candidatus Binatia bacterium]